MYRFFLNEQLSQFIREESIEKNQEKIIKNYLKELDYLVNVNINIGNSLMFISEVKIYPDFENKCMKFKPLIDKAYKDMYGESDSRVRLDKMIDIENLNIPFSEFMMGNVSVKTCYYGQRDITDTIVQMITDNTEGLIGYRYSFIKEAFVNDIPRCEYVYKINNTFYEVWYSTAGIHDDDQTHFGDKLSLTRVDNGQYCFRTAFGLLLPDYISNLEKTEDGLYIPDLTIQKYRKV